MLSETYRELLYIEKLEAAGRMANANLQIKGSWSQVLRRLSSTLSSSGWVNLLTEPASMRKAPSLLNFSTESWRMGGWGMVLSLILRAPWRRKQRVRFIDTGNTETQYIYLHMYMYMACVHMCPGTWAYMCVPVYTLTIGVGWLLLY